MRGKSVASKAEDMLAILQEILLQPRLDNYQRFEQAGLHSAACPVQGLLTHCWRLVGPQRGCFTYSWSHASCCSNVLLGSSFSEASAALGHCKRGAQTQAPVCARVSASQVYSSP